jgi:hypothetical protein
MEDRLLELPPAMEIGLDSRTADPDQIARTALRFLKGGRITAKLRPWQMSWKSTLSHSGPQRTSRSRHHLDYLFDIYGAEERQIIT